MKHKYSGASDDPNPDEPNVDNNDDGKTILE